MCQNKYKSITTSLRKNQSKEVTFIISIIPNGILTALNNKITVGGIFCDLHKAFDCVNHGMLPSKMEFYGIVGRTGNLIKSYLQNRYQRVMIKKGHSKLLLGM